MAFYESENKRHVCNLYLSFIVLHTCYVCTHIISYYLALYHDIKMYLIKTPWIEPICDRSYNLNIGLRYLICIVIIWYVYMYAYMHYLSINCVTYCIIFLILNKNVLILTLLFLFTMYMTRFLSTMYMYVTIFLSTMYMYVTRFLSTMYMYVTRLLSTMYMYVTRFLSTMDLYVIRFLLWLHSKFSFYFYFQGSCWLTNDCVCERQAIVCVCALLNSYPHTTQCSYVCVCIA